MDRENKIIVLIGADGLLGNALRKACHEYKVLDVARNNEDVFFNVSDKISDETCDELIKKVRQEGEIDAVINVAGKFAIDSLKNEKLFENVDDLMESNFKTALLAVKVASKCLKKNGLVVLTGAAKVFKEVSTCFKLISDSELPVG